MKRYIFTIALALGASAAQAQNNGDLSKQLEVTREYTPRVGQAAKLAVEPDMTDTVRLRPEITYRITSTASATSFSTDPFEAATISAAPFEVRGPLYVRLGAGVPFATEADIYFTPRTRTGSSLGIFANHSGSYSKITNDLGAKANATEMTNGAGVWATRQWKRYSLVADVPYDNRLYNPYGVADVDPDPASSARQERQFVYDRQMHRFSLGLGRAGVSFGDNFTDLSRFNFRVGLDGGYAKGHENEQVNFDARLTAAQMFGEGRHGFELVLAERGAFNNTLGSGNTNAVTVTLAPRYLLAAGVWSLRAGVDMRYVSNKMYDQGYFGFAPSFEIRANLAGGAFVPYLNYTSQIADGDYEALSRRNPYVVTGGMTAWINDARLGFEGDLGDVFSYKIAGGVSLFRDYQLFVGTQLISRRDLDSATEASYDPMWFTPLHVDGARMTAGAELALHNLGGFGARLYGNWNKFDFNGTYDFDPVGPLPDYDAGLELSYHHKDLFSVRLGAEFIGQREYLVRTNSSQAARHHFTKGVIAPVVDVTFGADVKISPDFWIFFEGENLADQVLYPYPHYRGLGANVLGGIKVVF
jgi:hypothetical protein